MQAKHWAENYKSIRNQRLKQKRVNDPVFALRMNIRSRLAGVMTHNKKPTMIGCSKQELKIWIEHQFSNGMTWDNYGNAWHLDHVVPVSLFDTQNMKQSSSLWFNLRPLEKTENMKRSNNVTATDIIKHSIVLSIFININHGYQTLYENTWWPRLELGDGKNSKDEIASRLKWAIRNEVSCV